MDRLRLWILGVALGSFAAGMTLGYAFSGHTVNGSAEATPDQAYADVLAARYGLTEQQLRSVRMVLQVEREEEQAIWTSTHLHQLPPAIMNRLLVARNRTRQRIGALLDPEQRVIYDRDCLAAGDPTASGPAAATTNR